MPADFDVELGQYTREGLRVLGLATRQLAGLSEGEVQGMSQVRGSWGAGRGGRVRCQVALGGVGCERLRCCGSLHFAQPGRGPRSHLPLPCRTSWRRACCSAGWR